MARVLGVPVRVRFFILSLSRSFIGPWMDIGAKENCEYKLYESQHS